MTSCAGPSVTADSLDPFLAPAPQLPRKREEEIDLRLCRYCEYRVATSARPDEGCVCFA